MPAPDKLERRANRVGRKRSSKIQGKNKSSAPHPSPPALPKDLRLFVPQTLGNFSKKSIHLQKCPGTPNTRSKDRHKVVSGRVSSRLAPSPLPEPTPRGVPRSSLAVLPGPAQPRSGSQREVPAEAPAERAGTSDWSGAHRSPSNAPALRGRAR